METISFRGIMEPLTEKEMKLVKGGDNNPIEDDSSLPINEGRGNGKCCTCTVVTSFCDDGSPYQIDGLFCGHIGSTNCYHILQQWMDFYTGFGPNSSFCGIYSSNCKKLNW